MTTRLPSPKKPARDPMEPHPVFSDFSHVANSASISQLTFAVGLRAENPEELVARMLPLTVIQPRPASPKKVKKKEEVEEKICQRPECVGRRERLFHMSSENDELRGQLEATKAKLASAQNKISLTEKAIGMSEDKIDSLRGQIDDTQGRIVTAEAEVHKMDSANASLRLVLANMMAELDRLKAQTSEAESSTQQVLSTVGENVVFSKSPLPRDAASVRSALETASLSSHRYNQADDDSEDED